jgi:acetylornithine/N-succinyldiaminopimelate aminotransferase
MIKNNIVYTDFSSWKFKLSKAKNCSIWDSKGKKYIDFTSGWNVANLGWNNEEIVEAGAKQLKENSFVPMWASCSIQDEYAKNLIKALNNKLKVVTRCTGGMEANEMAIKLARSFTGKKKLLSFYESYHGSSINALSLVSRDEWLTKLTDKREDLLLAEIEIQIDKQLSSNDFAAVITEANIISGYGTTYVAPKGFLELIRRKTKEYDVLLILDEVGTGFSRIGDLFGMKKFDIEPDIATFAKAISNGSAAIGAMVSTKEIVKEGYASSNLQSTFGFNPVACAIANKTLEIHVRDKVWEQAEDKGNYIQKHLKDNLKQNEYVGDIRGIGMEIGVDFVKDKKSKEKNTELVEKVVEKAFQNGLHLVSDHESNIQLMPPLTIDKKILSEGLDIFVSVIKDLT